MGDDHSTAELRRMWWLVRRVFRASGNLNRPEYLQHLRKADRFFLRTLFVDGAATAAELTETTKATRNGARRWPTRPTVEDWLLLSYRRGLLHPFEAAEGLPQRAGAPARWALTESGRTLYSGPPSGLRWSGRVLRYATQFAGWLAALVLGSAALAAAVGRVHWDRIVGSDAFAIALIIVFYALAATLLGILSRRHTQAPLALMTIELTRIFGQVAPIEVEDRPDRVPAGIG